MASIVFHDVGFAYDASTDGLLAGVSFGLSEGWTGVIGANGTGKTTLLRLACGELQAKAGALDRPESALYCPQRTDEPMAEFAALLDAVDGEAYRIRGPLGIEDDWLDRWGTLSHGERKRAQIGTSLWLAPELLAVDEPTNHLDRGARRMVVDALRTFRGVGLLVSHDRDLLDDLCGHCLFVDSPTVALRSGGYTIARAALQEEGERARQKKTKARRVRERAERELTIRREHQRKADRARSKRGIPRKDHDAKNKIDMARVADAGAGKRLRQLEGRIRQAADWEASIRVRRPDDLGIAFQGGASSRNALIRLGAGRLSLGDVRFLRFPELIVQPADRVALVGSNGSGKSTLVRHIRSRLELPEERVVVIPQEIPAERASAILAEVRTLRGDRLGTTMQWVSRLGSDPKRLLESALPSPGEIRKLMLARHLALEPHLVIMDEPTNHMDLPSIECVEEALGSFPGGLLLVSHDERFLRALTTTRWEIEPRDSAWTQFELKVRVTGGREAGGRST